MLFVISVYQGLIRTCWHLVVLITEEQITDSSGMSEENFDTSNRKVYNKDYIPFWTYLLGLSSVKVMNTFFQHRVQYHTLHIRSTHMFSICCYCQPTKLREGNVFTRVCLSTKDIWWSSLETCSNLYGTTCTDIWWPLKHVRLASGRYAFYQNAFLLH